MLFNSLSFLIFFPIVSLLYFLLPHKLRWVLLLLASCIFYMAFIPEYILILFFLIGVDYIAGIQIEQSKGYKRKAYLILSILASVAVLFTFKYVNFFAMNIAQLANFFHLNYSFPLLKLLLPIGLSFHTFQSLSYVIEVYKKKQKAERHLGIYALYVMFYPQLVAGPIERPQNLLPQLHAQHVFSDTDASDGLKRMVIGFFKKVVIADKLALVVNQVYGSPQDYTGMPLLIASLAFAFQIYYDFSGYSDIAIGTARFMGIRLTENFHFPYFATSLPDFWRRWHMSLYSWFRDYIYIPLGGNRVKALARYRNILFVFTLSGLWHGAAWTYVFWGFLHGVYLILYDIGEHAILLTKKSLKSLYVSPLLHIISIGTTFTLVCAAWIVFRARTITDASYIFANLFTNIDKLVFALIINNRLSIDALIFSQGKGLGLLPEELLIAIASLGAMGVYEWLQATNRVVKLPRIVRYAIYIIFVLSIINLGITKKTPFIYFQF
ncbi:MAG: MBOAT family O-acyltransferase [Patescibacteria group bacterium]